MPVNPTRVSKEAVYENWNTIPEWYQTGSEIVRLPEHSLEYFERVRDIRYRPERFQCVLDFIDFDQYRDKVVLEIGTGQGCDLVEFAKAGARVIGFDLSIRNCQVVKKRLERYGLRGQVVCGDAETLPFPDKSVDAVYSFGVLHHTPHMVTAFGEIERVLRPGGTVDIMLYRRNCSLWRLQNRYWGLLFFSIVKHDWGKKLCRQIGQRFGIKTFMDQDILDKYQALAKRSNFNIDQICAFMTDGPENPLSQFVTAKDVRRGFPNLTVERFYPCYLGPIPFIDKILPPTLRKAMGRVVGGFLFARLRKPAGNNAATHTTHTVGTLSDLLVDPVTKERLQWSSNGQQAISPNGRYSVVDGIPIMRHSSLPC